MKLTKREEDIIKNKIMSYIFKDVYVESDDFVQYVCDWSRMLELFEITWTYSYILDKFEIEIKVDGKVFDFRMENDYSRIENYFLYSNLIRYGTSGSSLYSLYERVDKLGIGLVYKSDFFISSSLTESMERVSVGLSEFGLSNVKGLTKYEKIREGDYGYFEFVKKKEFKDERFTLGGIKLFGYTLLKPRVYGYIDYSSLDEKEGELLKGLIDEYDKVCGFFLNRLWGYSGTTLIFSREKIIEFLS